VFFVTYDLDLAAKMSKVLYIRDDRTATVMSQRDFVESDMFTKRLLKLKAEDAAKPDRPSDDLRTVLMQIEDEESEEQTEAPKKQIIQDEKVDEGAITWETYKRFYSYGPFGLWSIVFVVFMHVVINFFNLAVSIYLAFTLT